MKLHGAIASVLVAVVLTACVRESVDAPALRSIGTIGREHAAWLAGTHYVRVQPSVELNSVAGKVTVVEFFWYGSPQCYTLDPHLVLWNRRKPENIEFMRVPTTWGQYDRPHARLFYTLEALGRNDLHAVIFDTIHARGNRLANPDERQTLQLQLQFAKAHGIAERKFLDAYHSNTVAQRLSFAERLLLHYEVDKLPTLVVNGKFKTDTTRAGRSGELLMRLVSDLAVSEPVVD
jgi:thiol:disulfide interchange protein DsbA